MANDILTINVDGLDGLITNFENFVKFNRTATRQAMNETERKSQVAALRLTRKDWNIKARDLKKGAERTLATNANLSIEFSMKSSSIPLEMFAKNVPDPYVSKLTPTGKLRTGGAGVKYKLKKEGRGFKTLSKSFLLESKFGDHRMEIFTRRRSPTGNSSITAQYSITPSSMFKQHGADEFISTFMDNFEASYINKLQFNNAI